MTKILSRVRAVAAVLLLTVLLLSAAFSQQMPPDPGQPGGGRPGGRRPGGRGGDRRGQMMERVKKAADEAAYKAARNAIEAGKSEEEAKAEAKTAADEAIDKMIDEYAGRMGQRGGQMPGGRMNPEEMKRRIKERATPEIEKTATEAATRAVSDYRDAGWKEIEPRDELVDEDKSVGEISEAIKETTLFEDFKDITKLKLKKPVIIFFYDTKNERRAEKCQKLRENVLADQEFIDAAKEFTRLQVDIAKLNSPLKKKYRAISAPAVVFFDCTGKRLYRFTNPKQRVKTLIKKMEKFVTKSQEAREKAREQKEKDDNDK